MKKGRPGSARATSVPGRRTASGSSRRWSRGTATKSSSTPRSGGTWVRRVIFDKVSSGHEVAVVDLNGDGRDDIVANDNGRVTPQNPNATPGVHVFFAPADAATGEWSYRRIEDKAAMNSCVGADVNGDRRMDLVCTGAGGVIRWYKNTGPERGSSAGHR